MLNTGKFIINISFPSQVSIFFCNGRCFSFNEKSKTNFLGKQGDEDDSTYPAKECCNL